MDVNANPFIQAGSGDPSFGLVPDANPLGNPSTLDPLQYRPNSIKKTAMGDIITSSHAGLGNAQYTPVTALAMTTSQTSFALVDSQGRTIDAQPDISLYTGITDSSQRALSNQWPNVGYGLSNLPWMWYNNFGLSDNIGVVTSVAIRNNTSANVPVLIAIRWRILTNNTSQFEQAFTAS